MKILHVVGARPNYMKIAPIMAELSAREGSFEQVLVHTGQHYDDNMSRVFFEDLAMPSPDEYLQVGSATHAVQTAAVMVAFEPVLARHRPDWLVVAGDVNSTLACTLVAAKMGIEVAHIEAGLRSYDRSMPEEINRVVTDHIADLLFAPSRDAVENLRREGIAQEKIAFVGNVMIDSLVKNLPRFERCDIVLRLKLVPGGYALVTLHRPSNVDHLETLREVLAALEAIAGVMPTVFPVHPRTRKRIAESGLESVCKGVRFMEPLGYTEFGGLMRSAGVVITDSGGIQEETTYLGIPCLTVRPNTERPITIHQGTNRLVEPTREALVGAVQEFRHRPGEAHAPPELWDGRAACRIADVFQEMAKVQNQTCASARTTAAA